MDNNCVTEGRVYQIENRSLCIFVSIGVRFGNAVIYKKTAVHFVQLLVQLVNKLMTFTVLNSAGTKCNYFIFSNHF